MVPDLTDTHIVCFLSTHGRVHVCSPHSAPSRGLGKTLEVLSLIVAHRRAPLPPATELLTVKSTADPVRDRTGHFSCYCGGHVKDGELAVCTSCYVTQVCVWCMFKYIHIYIYIFFKSNIYIYMVCG